MALTKDKPLAQRYKLLYAYSAFLILSMLIGLLTSLHTALPASSAIMSPQDQRALLYYGLAIDVLFYGVLVAYLVTARNLSRLLLVIKALLVLDILGLSAGFLLKATPYTVLVSLVHMSFTVVMLKVLSGARKEVERQEHPKGVPAKPDVYHGSRAPRRLKLAIRIIFRICVAYFGLAVAFVGIWLVTSGNPSLQLVLHIPLLLLGVLLVGPYYLLPSRWRKVYAGALLLTAAWVIYSLHIPLRAGLLPAAAMPIPSPTQGPFTAGMWAIFHSSAVIAFFSLSVVFDMIVMRLQPNRYSRQLVILMLLAIILASQLVGSYKPQVEWPNTAPSPAPASTGSSIPVEQPTSAGDTISIDQGQPSQGALSATGADPNATQPVSPQLQPASN